MIEGGKKENGCKANREQHFKNTLVTGLCTRNLVREMTGEIRKA